MSSQMGKWLRFSLFGESHGAGVGVLIEGLPPGFLLQEEALKELLSRRSPGIRAGTSPRRETDAYEILSGLLDGRTTGAPLMAFFANQDAHSKEYEQFRRFPRPSHADYPASVRYQGYNDLRGGGHFSARLTAPWCFAGGIAMQILAEEGIQIGSHLASVGPHSDQRFDPVHVTREQLQRLQQSVFPLLQENLRPAMEQAVFEAAIAGDSLGGMLEVAAVGLPAGWGSPLFDNMESRIAAAMFSIPAVRSVEFGAGVAAAAMKGSEHNDPWRYQGDKIGTSSNHHGGVLGGLTTGMPLVVRIALKPTASIAQPQETVDLQEQKEAVVQIQGRHDPCIVLRAAPIAEAALALVLLDVLIEQRGYGATFGKGGA